MRDKSNLPTVLSRITEYLDSGGLWNPELADHAAVRDLILDARDEIDRLRRILAALREPSEAMLHEMTETWIATPWGANHWQAALRAAVTAAEQEVGQ